MEALYCKGCEVLLAVIFETRGNAVDSPWYCFSCASNITLVADTISVISGNPGYCAGLPNVPSEQDIIRLYNESAISECTARSATTKRWCRDKREELTEEKVSKLLAECRDGS